MSDFGYRKVGAASIPAAVANPVENAKHALAAIQQAQTAGVQALVLPELCLSGCTCGDLFRQDTLLSACEAALFWLLGQTKDIAMLVAVGLPMRVEGRLYNCAAVIQSGTLLGFVPKQYLQQEEKRWFAPYNGEQTALALLGSQVPFGRLLFRCGMGIGIEFGDELWAPVPPSAQIALQGAEIILVPSAFAEEAGGHARLRKWIAQQSARLHCGYVLANAGPLESTTDMVYSGVCIAAENGSILVEGSGFAQEGTVAYACVDLELLCAERRFGPFYDVAHSLESGFVSSIACAPPPMLEEQNIDRQYAKQPFVPEDALTRAEFCHEVLDIQTAGLVKRLKHTNLKKMILGVSGGLDSTLALLVALRACGVLGWEAGCVLGVTMPGFGTTGRTRQTVDDLAAALMFSLREIDIRPACELHMRDIGHDPQKHDATYENVQARERTQILMDLANQENALLLGTGDLSELALGWCTYNGDHMSMYNLNGGVPKTLLSHLIEYAMTALNTEAGIALRRVLDTPVSPELLPPDENGEIVQRTEDTLGRYDAHDFYLYHFYRFGFAPAKLHFMAARAFADQYSPAQLKEWLIVFLRRFFSQQFKRSCLPDGPRTSAVNLSPRGGWRMPSDACAELWLAQANEILPQPPKACK